MCELVSKNFVIRKLYDFTSIRQVLCLIGLILVASSQSFLFAQNGNIILEYNTNIQLDNGKLIEEKSVLIQINDNNSDWISEVEISYGENEKLQILEASIINSQGQVVRKLKKKEIVTRSDVSSGTFYENSFVKEFSLKWNKFPYLIKYVYRTTVQDYIYITKWHPLLFRNVPIQNASLKVHLPTGYEVLMNYSESLKHETDIQLDHSIHSWNGDYTSQLKNEPFGVNFYEKLPHVTIVPKKFRYSIEGQFDSWSSYGNWHAQLNADLDELPESERIIVDRIINGINDKKEIANKLYKYMQSNTRYINVSIDEGGLVPYPASYVCTNKYGDCKALTIYMKALLKYAGIESYYTIIYAGDNPVRINESFPSQQFNHVILSVPLAMDTIWLENTANYLPFNYLGTFTQNRTALLIDGDKSKLVRTPSLKMKDVHEESQYNMAKF